MHVVGSPSGGRMQSRIEPDERELIIIDLRDGRSIWIDALENELYIKVPGRKSKTIRLESVKVVPATRRKND